MSALLLARGLFKDIGDGSKAVCPTQDESGPTIVPFVGNVTYHTFSTILAGACGALSTVIVLFLVFRHASQYSNPLQQRQIIRIICIVPYVSIFSFLIVLLGESGQYLVESLDFGCSLAMSAFLLLMCDFILQQPGGFDDLFGQGAWERGQLVGDSPPFLKRTWYSVLQFIPVSAILWIVTIITKATGTYCETSKSPHFAHIWITVIKFIATVIAIVAILRFYGHYKPRLQPQKMMLKLFAFKGLIGLNVIQSLIINLLMTKDTVKPTKYMTYHDLNPGLSSLILACEMPFFAVLLLFAFPVAPYTGKPAAAGAFTAIFDAINYSDILSAFVRGPMRLVRGQQRSLARQESVPLTASPPSYGGGVYHPEEQQKMGVERA